MSGGFDGLFTHDDRLGAAADVAVEQVLAVGRGEKVLIVSNPPREVASVSTALYDAARRAGARPVLIFQDVKSILDFAESAVLAAIESRPSVFVSVSHLKLGKDAAGIREPYRSGGKSFDHVFHHLLWGTKELRGFWSPSVNVDMFCRSVPIDYSRLRGDCRLVKRCMDEAVSIRVTAPAGTDMLIGCMGRRARTDDGDFRRPGSGGNLPSGETFISPELGVSTGRIVFDGSLSLKDGAVVLDSPVVVEVKDGFIVDIDGTSGAEALRDTIGEAEERAVRMEERGKLPKGQGRIYRKNAMNIGELGIGLNRSAKITGAMLEDEKVYGTCHVAVGKNYDEDAPSLIHLDGLIKRPTVSIRRKDRSESVIMENGRLLPGLLTDSGAADSI